MNSAAFLFAFNFAIGLAFAVAFLLLTWRSSIRLGRWCAGAFLAAATTVGVEALAPALPWVRLTSALSFGTLMLALTLIAVGLARHYIQSDAKNAISAGLATLCSVCVVLNVLIVFDLTRGSWQQALAYQAPFALITAIAVGIVLTMSGRRAPDLALAFILSLCSLQFVAKIILTAQGGSGPGVRVYIYSEYAFYSQTVAGVLSLLLGLSLIGVVLAAVLEESQRRFQRDLLSGVLNRSAFIDRIGPVLKQSVAPSSLIICDLDHFKSVNDRFGHAAGDQVISAFGGNLRAQIGEDGLCGRLGGEEFCILLPRCGPDAARAQVDAIRLRMRGNRYAMVPPHVEVTASFGIAIMEKGEPFERALHRADMALYAAKAAGRNCYCFAPAATDAQDAPPSAAPFRIRQIWS